MLLQLGFLILSLGVMMGDSELLIVPVTVSLIGLAMMYAGREEVDDENEIDED